MENIVDVLIVGSGVSGLYCALNLDEKLNVLVVSKSNLKNTNTYLAQGGISTARNNNDIELFIEDTLKAGQHKNKIDSVSILANESIENIDELIKLGVDFDKEVNDGLRGTQKEITKPGSKVRVFVIPTNEELAIARETLALVK